MLEYITQKPKISSGSSIDINYFKFYVIIIDICVVTIYIDNIRFQRHNIVSTKDATVSPHNAVARMACCIGILTSTYKVSHDDVAAIGNGAD